jgi:segregation and condensation protein B
MEAEELVENEIEETFLDEEVSSNLELRAQLGSLLFVSTKPLTIERLAKLTHSSIEDVEQALAEFKGELIGDIFGFHVVEVSGGFQLRSDARNAGLIKQLIPARAKKLSRAASETLAVIAYKQPVQKAEIDSIRGVDSLPTLKTLLDGKLIRIVGHENSAGHPALYGTTSVFLDKFGLSDLADLPSVREMTELDSDPGEA